MTFQLGLPVNTQFYEHWSIAEASLTTLIKEDYPSSEAHIGTCELSTGERLIV